MSAVRSVLVGTCGLLLLTSCAGGVPKATTVRRSAPVVTASQSASPPVSVAVGKSYVEVLASGNGLGATREGLKLTPPNSVAYRYLDHAANMQEASLDADQPPSLKQPVVPVGGDAFKFCSDKLTCVTFGGFKVNQDGKLVDLTVNNEPVGPRLTMGNGQPVTAAGATFTLLTAYQSVTSNMWFITVKVQTGAEAITINPKLWSYRGPDGKPLTWVGGTAATHVVSKADLIVVVTFDSAKAGGRLTVGGCRVLGFSAPGDESRDCPGAAFSAVLKVG
jgi:hypothetical protein